MSEYIDREAVMQAFADYVWNSNHSDLVPAPRWNHAVEIVRDFPAADVVPRQLHRNLLSACQELDRALRSKEEVVRCRDCANWQTDWYLNDPSKNEHYCAMIDLFTTGGFFCADGERKEKNDEHP